MNISNFEHVVVLFVFGWLYLVRPNFCKFFITAILAIEIDQAFSYATPWWSWFLRADTLFDILGGLVGAGLAWVLAKNRIGGK